MTPLNTFIITLYVNLCAPLACRMRLEVSQSAAGQCLKETEHGILNERRQSCID